MLKATEAKLLWQDATVNYDEELAKVEKAIKNAATNGKGNVLITDIPRGVFERLKAEVESNGYQLHRTGYANALNIAWDGLPF